MKRAAFGIQMHSGWGVLVAVCGGADGLEILARRRIVTVDPEAPEAKQPYHYAARLEAAKSEAYLAHCAAISSRLAGAAIGELVGELSGRHYQVAGASILLASGRPLPPLEKILASHPLIHTAEGEFFRRAVSRACEDLQISVTPIRERDLDERAKTAFGNRASRVQGNIAGLGSALGPPWTKDHKTATLAALLVLVKSACDSSHQPSSPDS